MWVVVYMAQGKEMSDKIGALLTKEGFLFKIKPIYKNVDPENNYYKIMVPKAEASEAQKVLIENKYL
ncbi:MAG: hypothetical protein FWJ59_07225 [Caldicoprobacter sp.]|uniref:hypothetical protein n=1 Tax=Caldicoprobacter sp. TaxID=2004500 RepID=UPI001DD617A5|nr:hypothetical protein [Clostridia bacterium]